MTHKEVMLYIPTLLRELLLSESEGIVERTLYVEPAKRPMPRKEMHSDKKH